jgi:hypothetical protein
MSIKHAQTLSRLDAAISELQEIIRSHYPTASFAVGHSEDPDGIYLQATVDVEDTDAVLDLVIDRLVQMQVDEAVPIYLLPVRPAERIAALLKRQSQRPLS